MDNELELVSPQTIKLSLAQQNVERSAMLARWPTGERKPRCVDDPFFAQFCFAIAEMLLTHEHEKNRDA